MGIFNYIQYYRSEKKNISFSNKDIFWVYISRFLNESIKTLELVASILNLLQLTE